jgi:DNA-directed RNA polymerase subunit M/transcription elongation factor TFIIS
MAEILREYTKNSFDKYFGPDQTMELELYDFLSYVYLDKNTWDHEVFERNYKYFVKLIILNKDSQIWKSGEKLQSILNRHPSKWSPELYEIEDNVIQEVELKQGQYKCPKCDKNKVYCWNTSYTELQTRSSDEPMSIFIHCETCHHRYKTS